VATTSLTAARGRHRLGFRGVVHGRPLAPGAYQVVFTASAGGLRSGAHRLAFTILR
jgi:hypothetical protein